ncbi:NADH-FMN oxidoreductase RutF, flavin reductase (DIM6/NTAB) family [Balnearium lithotrophicum]|uniref:NADH-FMN oxidoreductase RutF, flavin reductase (DIM6/NTAB) family n=1 Tax=Balnearium lithotrophicum TaxID=223788 RepID=A0A521BVM7_9BACT|nr:NADH-FMN oxidoreductase RutF, flavin reductase (DIM6/NTAB) family [Balnearium lithotrophicum]
MVSEENQKLISKLIFSTIVPRPIAWITTVSKEGAVNLAPFSFFNAVTTKPPLLFVSVGKRKDGSLKDTSRNIVETGEFVVNVVSEEFLEKMHLSGKDFPPEVSEPEELGISLESSEKVKPPRVKGVPASLECVLREHLNLGSTPMDVFIGEVVSITYSPEILNSQRGIVGRLGGKRYCIVKNEVDLSNL